jgi:hypothetical protein
LFIKTRLAGAPDPILTPELRSDDSQEAYWKLVRAAQNAALSGNIVRAAILRMRASRIAPAAQTLPTRLEAEADIAALVERLAQALGLSETEAADWTRHLTLLLDKADQGTRPYETRVLEELQQVCLDHEREIYTLDLLECIRSGFRRPIKRPLPSQRLVRITKHLRTAGQMLQEVRLSDTDRGHLSRLIQGALNRSEESLRARFTPVLTAVMQDEGLRPRTPIERAAFDKMVAELLDRIIQYGFLTFSELRDTISRNQLKLPDIEPEHFLRGGDPLLRLDRRLGELLDGVYRPSEFYTRWLERGTSLLFGTWWGRWVTRHVIGPFLLAWLILFMAGFLLEEVASIFHSEAATPVVQVLMGPTYASKKGEMVSAGTYLVENRAEPPPHGVSIVWHFALLIPLGFFLLALIQNSAFRERCLDALVMVWRGLRVVVVDLPAQIIPVAAIRRIVNTAGFQFFYWYVVKPAVLTALIVLVWRDLLSTWYWPLVTFVLVNFLVNSQVGKGVSESLNDALVQFGQMVRSGLLVGLVRFIMHVFKQAIEFVEYMLFTVDEWLRFRSGAGRLSLVVRTILGVLWAPISFLARFYMVVLIEPGINPVKLPVAILAGKMLLPLIPAIQYSAQQALGFLPDWLAYMIVLFHIFWLPDVFAFLVWEFKENWSLYRSNRSKFLEPISVGSHGETVRGLLQPGFHSGTVPVLFARLREAEREASRTRNWQRARAYRHEVEEVEVSLQRFVTRTMVSLLQQSRSWGDSPPGQEAGDPTPAPLIEAGPVHLATNRIRFELNHAAHPAIPVEFEIEHHHRWLLAGIRHPGWLEHLSADQLQAFATCLAGLYKLAGLDLVREQLLASLPAVPAAARLTEEGVQVWWDVHGDPVSYPLRRRPNDPEQAELLHRLVFSRTPIEWEQWVACWQSDQEGRGHPGLPGMSERVLPRNLVARAKAAETPPAADPGSDKTISLGPTGEVPQTNPA